ncbi:MAG: tetratricopeptide repeat protein [Planctomycetota bacterium]
MVGARTISCAAGRSSRPSWAGGRRRTRRWRPVAPSATSRPSRSAPPPSRPPSAITPGHAPRSGRCSSRIPETPTSAAGSRSPSSAPATRRACGGAGRLFDAERSVGPLELKKVAQLVERRRAPRRFVDRIRRWQPPTPLEAGARLELGRALRLVGASLEARLCLRGLAPEDLPDADATRLMRERLALGERDFEQKFAALAAAVTDPAASDASDLDRDLLRRALEREPAFWPACLLRGLWIARDGDLEDAVQELDHVLAAQPSNDMVWFTRAIQLRKLGRLDAARSSLERALAIRDDEGDYHAQLAMVAVELRDLAAARRHLERSIVLRPEHPDNDRLREAVDALSGR